MLKKYLISFIIIISLIIGGLTGFSSESSKFIAYASDNPCPNGSVWSAADPLDRFPCGGSPSDCCILPPIIITPEK